ncbi:hypothetical protein Hypma_014655 [Hypsizygus marmoreus]|uniref:Uncharacterized protein n=1 Tax=Hypsizygus marmoreus TaxID=39966 RepID=A0A369J9U5_HYPMA|nr:hypothetical protein Hypma_014655 [Hypsizygus marmoreus]
MVEKSWILLISSSISHVSLWLAFGFVMVRSNVAFAAAVFAIGVGSAPAVPLSDDGAAYLVSRDIDDDFLYARNPTLVKAAATEAGKKVYTATAKQKLNGIIKGYLHKDPVIPPGLVAAAKAHTTPASPAAQAAVLKLSQHQGLADAAKRASGPFNPSLVNAVVNNPYMKKVTRDILDILEVKMQRQVQVWRTELLVLRESSHLETWNLKHVGFL